MTIGLTSSYTTVITVKEVKDTDKIIWITDEDGTVYSYFKNDGELEKKFEEKIKVGAELGVFIKVKRTGEKTYYNLFINPFARSNQ